MVQIMQKWQWEVCKMFMYMTFPVAMFHYFNSPQIFEQEVTKIKLETYPAISTERQEQIEEMIRETNARRERKNLQKLQEN